MFPCIFSVQSFLRRAQGDSAGYGGMGDSQLVEAQAATAAGKLPALDAPSAYDENESDDESEAPPPPKEFKKDENGNNIYEARISVKGGRKGEYETREVRKPSDALRTSDADLYKKQAAAWSRLHKLETGAKSDKVYNKLSNEETDTILEAFAFCALYYGKKPPEKDAADYKMYKISYGGLQSAKALSVSEVRISWASNTAVVARRPSRPRARTTPAVVFRFTAHARMRVCHAVRISLFSAR